MSLLEGHPELDEVIPFDRDRIRRAFGGIVSLTRFFKEIRARRFDLAIDLQGLFRSGLMTYATGTAAHRRIVAPRGRQGFTHIAFPRRRWTKGTRSIGS